MRQDQADAAIDPPSTTDNDLELRSRAYDHPDATLLIGEAQEFYVALYGGPDETPFSPEEFAPPVGRFLVGYWAGEPVATGGWRFSDAGVPAVAKRPAEIKRMFVRQSARHRGFARRMLAALEADAAAAGADWPPNRLSAGGRGSSLPFLGLHRDRVVRLLRRKRRRAQPRPAAVALDDSAAGFDMSLTINWGPWRTTRRLPSS